MAIDLLGTNVGEADKLAVTGAIALTGAKLSLNVPNPIPAGSKFTIIDNDGSDAITGTFQGVAEGGFVSAGGQSFTVSYVGGDGNDVVLTRSNSAPIVTNFTVNNGAVQRSRITTITVNFANPVDAAQFQTVRRRHTGSHGRDFHGHGRHGRGQHERPHSFSGDWLGDEHHAHVQQCRERWN